MKKLKEIEHRMEYMSAGKTQRRMVENPQESYEGRGEAKVLSYAVR